MSDDWQKSEPRLIRPFFTVATAEAALKSCAIRLFAGAEINDNGLIDLDPEELDRLEIVVFPNIPSLETWFPQALKRSSYELVVVARNSFVKRSYVAHRSSLTDDPPNEIALRREDVTEIGGGRDLSIDVSIVLSRNAKSAMGEPSIKSQWLSRKTFTLRAKTSDALFDVQSRTPEDWVREGFPADTLYSISYSGGFCEPRADGSGSIATVYVHADAYNLMAGKLSDQRFQTLLAPEIIAQVIEQSYGEWETLEDVPAASPLQSVLREFGKEKSISLAELKSLVSPDGRSKLRALLQARLQTIRQLIK
jgi:hypothetical protein